MAYAAKGDVDLHIMCARCAAGDIHGLQGFGCRVGTVGFDRHWNTPCCLLKNQVFFARSIRAVRAARPAAISSKAALVTKVARYPIPPNSTPPMVEPRAIDSWTAATIKPPPASASLGSDLASHAHQPTGAA